MRRFNRPGCEGHGFRFHGGSFGQALPRMTLEERTAVTTRRERWRSLCAGAIETAGNTFLLLVATRAFSAGATLKAWVAAGGSIGLLLSPVTINWVQSTGRRPAAVASRMLACSAVAMSLAALMPASWGAAFAACCVLALAMPFSSIPLLTQVYQDNYPADRRGRLFSQAIVIRIAIAIAFGAVAGWWLDPLPRPGATAFLAACGAVLDAIPGRERWLVAAFSAAFAGAAWSVAGIPSSPLPAAAGSHPLHAMRYVWTDPVFRNALVAWMLMGFANLAMLPLRVEYLGNPRHGLGMDATRIALYTLVIPNMARLLLSPVWGRLFDRMNFFALRCTLNVGFAAGIAAFFTSNSTAGLVLGAIVYGVSNAGGDVAWSLWTTKVAPPERVADYMSVHTFLTGIRGVLAPFAAFWAIQHATPAQMGWGAGIMILAATTLLLPDIRRRT